MISTINKALYLSEIMLKATETSKKSSFRKKRKTLKFLIKKNAKISFFWNELQKPQVLVIFFVASDPIVNHQRYIRCRV